MSTEFNFRLGGPSILVAIMVGAFCSCSSERDSPLPVVVLAAASTVDLLEELIEHEPQEHDAPVVSSGPSHALARQILAGAPSHLFVSAHRKWVDELRSARLAAESVDWIGNQLVLAVCVHQARTIQEPADLVRQPALRIAVGGPHVPAGMYAEQALTKLGVWEELFSSGRLVRGHDVRSTLNYLRQQEVDAAIVYATDVRLDDDIVIVHRFDQMLHDPIVYQIALTEAGAKNPRARQFFAYLQAESALQIAESHGFQTLTNQDQNW